MFLPDIVNRRTARAVVDGGGLDVGDHAAIGDCCRNAVAVASVGLPGDQIQMAHDGGAEFGVEEVVAHGVMLGIVPQRRDGVAVVVAHREIGRAAGGRCC